MHKNLLIAFTTILLIGFYACSHKTQTINPIVVTPVIPVDTTSNHTTDTIKEVLDTSVCFQRDILPIMQTACAKSGCHDAINKKSGYNLTSYSLIIAKGVVRGSANASKLFTACISFKMPPAPAPRLDSTQLTFLKRWINNGAHNDTNCAVNCDTTKYTYKAAIAPILNSYCNSCHASGAAASSGGGIVLDNYNGLLVQARNGKLMGDIMHSSGFHAMPVGGSMLSDCKITQFRKWIAAGALNN